MKIILTESQFDNLSENLGNDQMLNNILDKISKEGVGSLSDEEKNLLSQMSTGEYEKNTDDDENKYVDSGDEMDQEEMMSMIQTAYPEDFEEILDISGRKFKLTYVNGDYGDFNYKLIGQGNTLIIEPFYNSDFIFKVTLNNGYTRKYKIRSDNFPTDDENIGEYMDYMTNDLIPKLVVDIINKSKR